MLSTSSDLAGLDRRAQIVQVKIIELASLSLGRDLAGTAMDELLYGTQTGFDSIALMEFILRLEEEFGLSIPDEDLDPDIFGSIGTVVAYVLRRLDEGVPSAHQQHSAPY
jgi:acyl carrier protein